MNIGAIIIAALVVGGTGILLGFFLGIFGEKFKVEVDEREEAIMGVLPGNNCGGCGYAGCSGLAAAIVKGEAPVNQLRLGRLWVCLRRKARKRLRLSNVLEIVKKQNRIMNTQAWKTVQQWPLSLMAGQRLVIMAVWDMVAV